MVRIGVIKWMAAFAMCFAGIVGLQAFTPQDVDFMRNELQMQRIDAALRSAKMICFKSIWNTITEILINDEMGKASLDAGLKMASVPTGAQITQPQPATGIGFNVNSFSKTRRQRARGSTYHKQPHRAPKRAVGSIC